VADDIAVVAQARRELLLRVHRHRLRRDDLEDCYSQATLELIAGVRSGRAFVSRQHAANALELRFLSRIRDRRRALGGRSPIQAAVEHAASLAGDADEQIELIDARASVEALVLAREELRALGRALGQLTDDQRRVIASQLADEECGACCRRLGWTREKYRKVAQRARARLRQSMASHELAAVPPRATAS
jgi:DNA-directed RNA polymerase specialized sigma24 family protein